MPNHPLFDENDLTRLLLDESGSFDHLSTVKTGISLQNTPMVAVLLGKTEKTQDHIMEDKLIIYVLASVNGVGVGKTTRI